METSLVNSSFSICLLQIFWFSVFVRSWNYSCPQPETTCGNLTVRFPFRLIGSQPPQCGYPGFDLQCSSNQAVVELPGSVKLNVKFIDYISQTIQLYDPSGCFLRHARKLDLFPSPFQFINDFSNDDFTFFNCSSSTDIGTYSKCLSSSTYRVSAIDSDLQIAEFPLLFCSKISNTSSIPYEIVENDDTLDLKWMNPMCHYCESKGVRCGFMKNDNISYDDACLEAFQKGK